MSLPTPLQLELAQKGYLEATAVQELVVNPEHNGRDLLVSSRTGSGKTIAFGLAAAPDLLDAKGKVSKPGDPAFLAIAPTRELALQVAKELTWLFRQTGARIATCVGGMDPRNEGRILNNGVHMVVGTPGRLCDHIDRGALRLANTKTVVLDEADEMLDMGFRDELERILQAASPERRTLMFSATIPREIESLAKKYTKDAVRIAATSTKKEHEDIEHVVHLVAPQERAHAVVNVLRARDAASALVFCATRDGVAHMAAGLVERGFSAASLSGELSQSERNRAIQAMRDGRVRVLVATDVAARGLDLPDVALVIHADLPHDAQVLQHRSGRTGRAGRKGTAVILVPYPRRRMAERLLRDAKISLTPIPPPSQAEIAALDAKKLMTELNEAVAALEPEDLEKGVELLKELSAEQAAALLWRRTKESLPPAEELPMTMQSGGRMERPERGSERDGPVGEGAWFHINVGRRNQADPKWLIPLICRRGGIEKRDIGRITILDNESRFDINPAIAAAFAEAASRPDEREPRISIQPWNAASAPQRSERSERSERPDRQERPRYDGPPRGPRPDRPSAPPRPKPAAAAVAAAGVAGAGKPPKRPKKPDAPAS